jgi:threonine dehydrogenase-like Zn-dependent dehydrogenase
VDVAIEARQLEARETSRSAAADDRREMDEAAAMLARDPEIARTLITHRYPIDDAGEAFRVAGDKASGAIRVVIEPT